MLNKIFCIPKNEKERIKARKKDMVYQTADRGNQFIDYMYNQRFPSKHDAIDSFNEGLEEVAHFADNYTKIPYGMIGSVNGRLVRENYQSIYARNPIPDKFDRAFDSYKKATEYDY